MGQNDFQDLLSFFFYLFTGFVRIAHFKFKQNNVRTFWPTSAQKQRSTDQKTSRRTVKHCTGKSPINKNTQLAGVDRGPRSYSNNHETASLFLVTCMHHTHVHTWSSVVQFAGWFRFQTIKTEANGETTLSQYNVKLWKKEMSTKKLNWVSFFRSDCSP